MSISTLRQELKDIPGAETLVMRYEDGGKTQVFIIGEKEVRLGPTAGADEIRAAILSVAK